MLLRIILCAGFLVLFSCSVPEDKLWPKRMADVGTLQNDSAVVAVLDMDVGASLDSLNQDSLHQIALRDLPIYAFGQDKVLDTARFVRDSVLPKLVMERAQVRLQQIFKQVPYLHKNAAWSTEHWRARQAGMLQTMLTQGQTFYAGPNILDSLLPQALQMSDTSIARIPVGAFLVKNHRRYWWVVLIQSGEKPGTIPIDSTDHPDAHFKHLQGLSFDANTHQPLGTFFSE